MEGNERTRCQQGINDQPVNRKQVSHQRHDKCRYDPKRHQFKMPYEFFPAGLFTSESDEIEDANDKGRGEGDDHQSVFASEASLAELDKADPRDDDRLSETRTQRDKDANEDNGEG